MLNENAKQLIRDFALGFVATVDGGGRPCVSPKGTFLVLDDDTVAFADIRSPGTLANLRAGPALEVNFLDVLKRKGLRLRGTARVVEQGAEFEELLPKWQAVWPGLAPRIKTLVIVSVEAVKPLITPPYDDGATEAEMIAMYKAKFAAMYE